MKTTNPHLIIAALAAMAVPVATAGVLTFEEFAVLPNNADYAQLSEATAALYGEENANYYGGVLWDFWALGSDRLVAQPDASDYWCSTGTQSFIHPHSGHIALFNSAGYGGLGFSTTQTLTGVWFARPSLGDDPGGAVQVTLTAFAGTTVVASAFLDLVDTTPVFMDTSSFLFLHGITRYTIDRVEGPGQCKDPGYFIADDFQFAATSLAELCPCDAAWKNHAEYMQCIRAAVSLFREDEALTKEQAKDIIKAANKSDCGRALR
jgi:hypothetical protein